jgi:predicted oxidoreductase (fatty acid repression mutant protein)
MSNQKTFFDAVKERRTYYHLNKESPIPDKQIIDIAEKAVLHVPSSFNSQSTRLVVLLNKDHDQFWDFVLEVLKPMVPEEQFSKTEQKIGGFKAGYGTVSARPSRQTTIQEGLRLANLQDACGRIEPALPMLALRLFHGLISNFQPLSTK